MMPSMPSENAPPPMQQMLCLHCAPEEGAWRQRGEIFQQNFESGAVCHEKRNGFLPRFSKPPAPEESRNTSKNKNGK
jgi:hypothetical protein